MKRACRNKNLYWQVKERSFVREKSSTSLSLCKPGTKRASANDGCNSERERCAHRQGFMCQTGHSLPHFSWIHFLQCYWTASLKGQIHTSSGAWEAVTVRQREQKQWDVDSKISSVVFWNTILSCSWCAVTPKARYVKMDLRDCGADLIAFWEWGWCLSMSAPGQPCLWSVDQNVVTEMALKQHRVKIAYLPEALLKDINL